MVPATAASPNRAVPSPIASAWVEQGPANVVAGIPYTQPSANDTTPFGVTRTLELDQARGAEIKVRLRYPAGMEASQECKGLLLGRPSGVAGAIWEVLTSRDGSAEVELTIDTTNDIGADEAGDYQITTCDLAKHSFETGGNTEFAFVVTQALTGTGAADARIELKPW